MDTGLALLSDLHRWCPDFTLIHFSHSLAFLELMSVLSWVPQCPHTVRCVNIENAFYSLCTEITIYSPPVTVTMARKGRALSTEASSAAAIFLCCFHISPLPWRPTEWAWLHCASDMPEGETWCAFLPHYGFHSAVSEALNFSISDGSLGLAVAHVKACAKARLGVWGKYLPQGWLNSNRQWGANC